MSRPQLDYLLKGLLPHPDTVGSTEYRAVYELLEDCQDLNEASALCEELREVAALMISKINQLKS